VTAGTLGARFGSRRPRTRLRSVIPQPDALGVRSVRTGDGETIRASAEIRKGVF